MAGGKPQTNLQETHDRFEAISQELTLFTQCVERQQQALSRLHRTLRSGIAVANDDRLVRDVIEATTAAQAALDALGLAQTLEPAVRAEPSTPARESTRNKEHEQLLAICSVSQTVNSTLDLSEVLNIVMDTIIRLTGAERGFVMLHDNETGELVVRTARNMDQESISGSSFQISLSIVNRVASEAIPVVTTNAQNDPRFKGHESVMTYSLRSILCVPLLVKNRVIGVIYADSRIRTALFSERDLDVLVTFANQVATAIDNARLFESVIMSKNLLDNLFTSIPSGVITVDNQGKITSLNPVAEKILGLPAKVCIGASYGMIFTEAWAADLEPLVEQVRVKEQRFVGYEIETTLPKRGLLNLTLSNARGVLFNVKGGEDLGLVEASEAAEIIRKTSAPDANIIFGAIIDPAMKDTVQITLIATGFGQNGDELAAAPQPPASASVKDQELPAGWPPGGLVIDDPDVDIPPFLRK